MSRTETLGGDLCSHGRSVGDCGVCLETLKRLTLEAPLVALLYEMAERWERWKAEPAAREER